MRSASNSGNNLSNGVAYGALAMYCNSNGVGNSNATNWGARPTRDSGTIISCGAELNCESHKRGLQLQGESPTRHNYPIKKHSPVGHRRKTAA